MTTYVLAFYEIDRAYGGPEEGGWWYDTGQLVRVWRTLKTEEKGCAVVCRANRILKHLQRHRPDVGSVIYTGGRHSVAIYEDFAPKFYPEIRPHYEEAVRFTALLRAVTHSDYGNAGMSPSATRHIHVPISGRATIMSCKDASKGSSAPAGAMNSATSSLPLWRSAFGIG